MNLMLAVLAWIGIGFVGCVAVLVVVLMARSAWLTVRPSRRDRG